jgi:hypothetical protein
LLLQCCGSVASLLHHSHRFPRKGRGTRLHSQPSVPTRTLSRTRTRTTAHAPPHTHHRTRARHQLLADGIRESFIAVMPSREASVYGRSYWAHVVSGLADFWLSELVYRASLPQLQRHFPNLFPPPQPLGIHPRRTLHTTHRTRRTQHAHAPHTLNSFLLTAMWCVATFCSATGAGG